MLEELLKLGKATTAVPPAAYFPRFSPSGKRTTECADGGRGTGEAVEERSAGHPLIGSRTLSTEQFRRPSIHLGTHHSRRRGRVAAWCEGVSTGLERDRRVASEGPLETHSGVACSLER